MNKKDLYIKARASSGPTPIEDWVRPTDWLAMPTVTSSDDTFVGLHAVIEDGDNYCSFRFTTSAGQYEVDWGDGSTPTLHDSNTTAQYEYDFATVSSSTLTSRGYKQAIITVTPVSGLLRTCTFQIRFVTSPTQNQSYSTGFLDCILSMPNASTGASIVIGGTIVRHSYCERFDIKTIGDATSCLNLFNGFRVLQSIPLFNTENVTSMSIMFNNCTLLKKIPLFNTQNVTTMASMFSSCSSLQTVPLFNTISVTTMQSMFNSCLSLKTIPLFNTINVTTMLSMLSGCQTLQTVPLFNTISVTTMQSMFNNCIGLQFVPLFNTENVTVTASMFSGCVSLQTIPLFNTIKVENMNGMFATCSTLNSIPALSTVAITTILGTDFGTSFTSTCNSLNRCQMIFARQVTLSNCQLSRDALVEIFTNLVDRSSTTAANINITGNWGATALSIADRNIALNKNWTITG
jgi:surface protein